MNAPDLIPGTQHRCADGRRRTVWACPACGVAFVGRVELGGHNGRTSGVRCPDGHWTNYSTMRRQLDTLVGPAHAPVDPARETDLGLSRAWLERYDHLAGQLSHHSAAAALIAGTFGTLAEITRKAVE